MTLIVTILILIVLAILIVKFIIFSLAWLFLEVKKEIKKIEDKRKIKKENEWR